MTLTPRMQIVWEVLEAAKDCQDQDCDRGVPPNHCCLPAWPHS
jgi:hypothetical protein